MPRAGQGQGVREPFPERCRSTGSVVGKTAGQSLESGLGFRWIWLDPGGSQTPLHERPLDLGQMFKDISLLVAMAAVDCNATAKKERMAEPMAEPPSTTNRNALGHIETSVAQIGQERARPLRSRRALGDSQRHLVALGVNAQGSHEEVLAHVPAVEHQHKVAAGRPDGGPGAG